MSNTHYVYIFRKAHGGLHVHPSPFVVQNGDQLVFRNLTDGAGKAVFRDGTVAKPVDLPAQRPSDPVPVNGKPGFYDYRVTLTFRGTEEYIAEGGSDPGVIIDV